MEWQKVVNLYAKPWQKVVNLHIKPWQKVESILIINGLLKDKNKGFFAIKMLNFVSCKFV